MLLLLKTLFLLHNVVIWSYRQAWKANQEIKCARLKKNLGNVSNIKWQVKYCTYHGVLMEHMW